MLSIGFLPQFQQIIAKDNSSQQFSQRLIVGILER
jgi:hypothetical protein